MSIPPGPPPGGYYSAPPRKSGVNGWAIAGFGCLGLFLLAAIGGVLLVRATKDQLSHPSKNSVIGIGVLAAKAAQDGKSLQQAVVAYHQAKGKYPKTLMQLVQEGAIDGKTLHNDLDDDPNPGHVSWTYTKPAEGAPGETPILTEPYRITMGGSTQSSSIGFTLDGRSVTANTSGAPPPQGKTP